MNAPVIEWTPVQGEPVPESQFGKDHWSLLAYAETRTVDYRGTIEHDHLRCHARRHPEFFGAGTRESVAGGVDASDYATRLRGEAITDESGRAHYGVLERYEHDDYDCLNDLVAAGLIEIHMPGVDEEGHFLDGYGRRISPDLTPGEARRTRERPDALTANFVTGHLEGILRRYATVSLTERGQRVAGELRAYKAASNANSYHQFTPAN